MMMMMSTNRDDTDVKSF